MAFPPSRSLLNVIAKQFSEALFYEKTKTKIIGLTIDDIGDPSTKLIVDSIKEYNDKTGEQVRATFFPTTSYLDSNKKIITDISREGHEIGNHGVYDRSHAELTPSEFAAEILQAHQILQEHSESPIKWYRPARGRYNQNMVKTLYQMALEYGYIPKFALASVIPLDTYSATRNTQFSFNYLTQFIFPGSILVLHGGTIARAENTTATLSLLLPHLHKLGYRITTLTELKKASD